MVRGPRRERALAERGRAESILRSRIHSLKRLRRFLCANEKFINIRNRIRVRRFLGLPTENLSNRVGQAFLAVEQAAATVRELQYVMVSTVADMISLVELRRNFGGWEGKVSVDPRATRFTRSEIRRLVVEEDMKFDNYRP
nr:hypothetical protein CFP56_44209 [Quercus suber]